MIGNFFGGVAEGQRYREDSDRKQEDLNLRKQEAEQMKRMREYQLRDMQSEQDLGEKIKGISEYNPVDPNTPDAPRTRRAQRSIDFDRANAFAASGLPKYVQTAQQLRMGAYEADRKEFDSNFARISSMQGSDADKIAAATKFLSDYDGIPGKISVAPSATGKGYTVNVIGADGKPREPYTVASYDELYNNVNKGLSYQNYAAAHQMAMQASAEGRAQALAPAQQRSAVAAARTAESGATVAEKTEPARIAAPGIENNLRGAQANSANANAELARSGVPLNEARVGLINAQTEAGGFNPNGRGGGGAGARDERAWALAEQVKGNYGGDVARAYASITGRKQAIDADIAQWQGIETQYYKDQMKPAEIAQRRDGFFASRGIAPQAAIAAVRSGVNPATNKPFTQRELADWDSTFPKTPLHEIMAGRASAAAPVTEAAPTPAPSRGRAAIPMMTPPPPSVFPPGVRAQYEKELAEMGNGQRLQWSPEIAPYAASMDYVDPYSQVSPDVSNANARDLARSRSAAQAARPAVPQ